MIDIVSERVIGHAAVLVLRIAQIEILELRYILLIGGHDGKHVLDSIWSQRLGREGAQKVMHKSDSERRGFLQFAFHKDWDDLSLYDLIINRDKLRLDSAAKRITEVKRRMTRLFTLGVRHGLLYTQTRTFASRLTSSRISRPSMPSPTAIYMGSGATHWRHKSREHIWSEVPI